MTHRRRSVPESSAHLPGAPAREVAASPGALRLVASDGYSERELVERIRRNDVDAFERLFRAYFGALCAVVNGYVRSPDIAEELVQDLLLNLWHHRSGLNLRESLRVYLFRAARNRALNSLRHTRREISWARDAGRIEVESPLATPDAHECLETSELTTAVGIAIAAMPERRRLVFQLTQQVGLSHAETGAVMGITPKTVAIHLGLARQELRSRLARFLDR